MRSLGRGHESVRLGVFVQEERVCPVHSATCREMLGDVVTCYMNPVLGTNVSADSAWCISVPQNRGPGTDRAAWFFCTRGEIVPQDIVTWGQSSDSFPGGKM